jgi:hypothetical protein
MVLQQFNIYKVKKIILILNILFITFQLSAQTQLTVGMTGSQVRAAINNNFDTVYYGNMRHGVEIGGYLHDNRIDSARVDGSSLRMYHGSTLLNTSGTVLSVTDYGAKGDGSTDDRSAIINCITAALAINGTIYFPWGTSGIYYCSASITTDYSNKDIAIICAPGVTILGTSSLDSWIFTTTLSATTTFTSSPAKGAISLALTSASGISANDILEIRSTDQYCNINVSNVSKGELCTVQKISGNTIYINHTLYDDYNMATTTIRKVNSGKLDINGLTFKNIVLDVRYVRNSVIKNCNFIIDGYMPIAIADAYDFIFDHCTMTRGQGYTNQGIYCMSIASSQNLTVSRCMASTFAQGILCGGEHHPTRNYTIKDCYLVNMNNAIDVHAQVEYATIIGNTLYGGGIYAKGSYVDILQNEVISGYIIRLREDLTDTVHNIIKTGYENIVGNKVYNLVDSLPVAGQNGISITFNCYRDTVDYINVSNNYVNSPGYAFIINTDAVSRVWVRYFNIENNYFKTLSQGANAQQPTVYCNSSISYGIMRMHHNIIINKGTSGTIAAVYLSNSGNFSNIQFENNELDGKECYLVASLDLDIRNNIFNSTQLITHADGGKEVIQGNIFKGSTPSNDADILCGETSILPLSIYIKDNIYETGTTRNVYPNCVGCGTVLFRDETRYFSGSLTDGAPTNTEVNAIVGTSAANMGNGFKAVIKDTTGTALTYTFISDGTSWILQGVPVKAL